MKRFLLSLLMVAMITFLAGCISIPLGDDVLEISGDGVKLYKGGKEEAIEDEGNDDGEDNNENDDVNLNDEANADDEVDSENNADENESNAEESTKGMGTTSQGALITTPNATCPEELNTDYSRLEKFFVHEFYLPECSDLGRVNMDEDSISFKFNVHDLDFEEIFDEYLDYFDEITTQEIDPTWSMGWAKVNANLVNAADEMSTIGVTIEQKEEYAEVSVRYNLPVEEEDEEEED